VPVAVHRITADDAQRLRAVRLAALADSPTAFGSTWEREAAFDAERWRDRAVAGASGAESSTWLAFEGEAVVGIAGGYRPDPAVPAVDVVSMWVAPSARRSGAGRLLVATVVDWARAEGAASVSLWVTRGNEPAQRLYESMGFVETGDHQPLPSDPCKDEVRMALALR
jgi:GNAT superfamily N-acetyltransferase